MRWHQGRAFCYFTIILQYHDNGFDVAELICTHRHKINKFEEVFKL